MRAGGVGTADRACRRSIPTGHAPPSLVGFANGNFSDRASTLGQRRREYRGASRPNGLRARSSAVRAPNLSLAYVGSNPAGPTNQFVKRNRCAGPRKLCLRPTPRCWPSPYWLDGPRCRPRSKWPALLHKQTKTLGWVMEQAVHVASPAPRVLAVGFEGSPNLRAPR